MRFYSNATFIRLDIDCYQTEKYIQLQGR